MKTLVKKVEYVLEKFPETRNSDIELTIKIWDVFYPGRILKNKRDELLVRVRDMFDLPREDNVKRIRARIQNEENRFLPTDIKVVRARRINEAVWRETMGYKPVEKDPVYDVRKLKSAPQTSKLL